MKERNINLISGEIWSELNSRAIAGEGDFYLFRTGELLEETMEVISGVLARHIGSAITQDEGFPVNPLDQHPMLKEDPDEM